MPRARAMQCGEVLVLHHYPSAGTDGAAPTPPLFVLGDERTLQQVSFLPDDALRLAASILACLVGP